MEVLLINILDFLDIWSIHYFQSFQAMELVDRPFQKGSWSFGVGLPRMACAFACETSAWNSESPPPPLYLWTKFDEERRSSIWNIQ